MTSYYVLLLLVPLVAVTVEACSSTKKSVDPVAEPETTAEPGTAGIVDIVEIVYEVIISSKALFV